MAHLAAIFLLFGSSLCFSACEPERVPAQVCHYGYEEESWIHARVAVSFLLVEGFADAAR